MAPRRNRRSPGEGTISQRKDGRWQASLQIDGRRRTVYGRTRAEAAARLQELKAAALQAGTLPDPGGRTLGDLLNAWLDAKAPTVKARTLADYRYTCDTYVRPTLGSLPLARIGAEHVERLLVRLQGDGRGRTAQLTHGCLSQALALAVRWGWVAVNPCDRVDPPRYRRERREVWGAAELARFLDGTRDHWLYPLWALLACSGLRLGEALALQWADVDLRAGVVSVSKTMGPLGVTPPKTAAGTRALRLPALAVAALARQAEWRLAQGGAAGPVFVGARGGPLHHTTVGHALLREAERLGLPALTPHGLRHVHASLLLSEGLSVPEVSRRLRHAHPGVTMAVYAHALGRDDAAAAEAMARALGER